MANKRNLKKQIRYICGSIAGECLIARELVEGIDTAKMNDIVLHIAKLQSSAIKNGSFSFDKTPRDFDSLRAYHKAARAYHAQAYAKLHEEFNNSIQQIVKDMNGLLPAAQREENKKAASAK